MTICNRRYLSPDRGLQSAIPCLDHLLPNFPEILVFESCPAFPKTQSCWGLGNKDNSCGISCWPASATDLVAAQLYVGPIDKEVPLNLFPVVQRVQVCSLCYCRLICTDVEAIPDSEECVAAHPCCLSRKADWKAEPSATVVPSRLSRREEKANAPFSSSNHIAS